MPSARRRGFSILSLGTFKSNPGPHGTTSIRIPHLLSLIEDLSWTGKVDGIDQIQAQEQKQYGPSNYVPTVGVEYWTFRLMIGGGILMFLISVLGIWLGRRRGTIERSRWFQRFALLGVALPILSNWCGWIFTEVGRQPWVVFGLLKTDAANSPNVATGDIVFTLAGYIVLYGVLIAVGAWLMLKEAKHGPEPEHADATGTPGAGGPHNDLILAY